MRQNDKSLPEEYFVPFHSERHNHLITKDNVDEYIWDMLRYKDKEFAWKETPEVFDLIIDFLTYAKQTGQTIVMEMDY